MRKRYIILIVSVILAILVMTIFVFTFLYQAQTQGMFKVTINFAGKNNIVHYGYLWHVSIEQLSVEELKNVQVIIDVNSRRPFLSISNNKTSTGYAQEIFDVVHQPTNITLIWTGGKETFLFRDSPVFSV